MFQAYNFIILVNITRNQKLKSNFWFDATINKALTICKNEKKKWFSRFTENNLPRKIVSREQKREIRSNTILLHSRLRKESNSPFRLNPPQTIPPLHVHSTRLKIYERGLFPLIIHALAYSRSFIRRSKNFRSRIRSPIDLWISPVVLKNSFLFGGGRPLVQR